MLDATCAPQPASPYAYPHRERPYMEEIARAPGKLRIAWSSETPAGDPIDPDVQATLERTAETL
jgi:amidase